jgi:hypothetical protein
MTRRSKNFGSSDPNAAASKKSWQDDNEFLADVFTWSASDQRWWFNRDEATIQADYEWLMASEQGNPNPGQRNSVSKSDQDWPGNWPEITEEIREIARRGDNGNGHDHDKAHAELMRRGFTTNAAQYLILSSNW